MSNRNVLLRMRNQGNVPVIRKNVETVQVSKVEAPVPELKANSMNKNKRNPDVMQTYEREKDNINLKNIQYTNQTWKGVTGDSMNFKVDSSESFVLQVEEVDQEKMLADYNIEFKKREYERLEIERINKEIKEKMMENVMQMTDAICGADDINAEDTLNFDELKISTENSTMKVEQEGYNALLNEIGKL